MRISELFALRWGDNDWRLEKITVERAFTRSEMKVTKTGKVRHALMTGDNPYKVAEQSGNLVETMMKHYAEWCEESTTPPKDIYEPVALKMLRSTHEMVVKLR